MYSTVCRDALYNIQDLIRVLGVAFPGNVCQQTGAEHHNGGTGLWLEDDTATRCHRVHCPTSAMDRCAAAGSHPVDRADLLPALRRDRCCHVVAVGTVGAACRIAVRLRESPCD